MDPITLAISAAASGLGELLGRRDATKNAGRIADARNRIMSEILGTNDALVADSRNTFNTAVGAFDPAAFQATQADVTGARTDAITNAIAGAPQQNVALKEGTPSLVQRTFDDRNASAAADATRKGEARGRFGGFADVFHRTGLGNRAAGRDIAVNNNFAGGNLSIMPALQDLEALAAQRSANPFAAILKGLGQLGGSYAGAGGFGGAPVAAPKIRLDAAGRILGGV